MQNSSGFVKLDLFCKGLRVHKSCGLENDARRVLSTRGGLGSGLEMVLPGRVFVNAPVVEKFARRSPYLLKKGESGYFLERAGEFVCAVSLPRTPAFYSEKTSSGKLMSRIAVMQGSYLGVYPSAVCSFWKMRPAQNCAFCSVGLNVGKNEEGEKSVPDVVEVARAAKREEKITFVHLNTGFYGGNELRLVMPYVRALKNEGLLVGVQCPPSFDLEKYKELKKAGADHVSFCLEFWDEGVLDKTCPGKSRFIGRKRFLDAIAYCSKLFGKGRVAGELIAGIEPAEKTVEAIEAFAKMGAVSTVCVFRPCIGTKMENRAVPKTRETLPIFAKLYDSCLDYGIPFGIAPNVRVGMAMLPEECAEFSEKPATMKRHLSKFTNAAAKAAFRAAFAAKSMAGKFK
ncbi:MAG: radical SAM protein [Candidatus Micrarchaeia archaeon]|jgi:hypothetical protein